MQDSGFRVQGTGFRVWRVENLVGALAPAEVPVLDACYYLVKEVIDYKTSMITDEDPLRGLLFYQDLGFSHTTRS